jgi:outer membrane protein OmpA-like peptidoglycan-associated protein
MKGDSEDALVLTQARAMVVRDYLVNHFAFNDTRLKTLGLGKSKDTGGTGKVELIIYPETPK